MLRLDQKLKKRAVHRSKIIQGQIKGLTRGIEREEYCTNLLMQSLAIINSLKSLNTLLLENHLRTHVKHQLADHRQEKKAIEELLTVYKLSENK
ncbi:MAG: metal-sensitive transcriptional regulator [Candidatus Doudnabacteria bacterium]|nr:metal-sensitive transcriptional regulator [Candidatus Doudnabacteria bacterium]